jgi:hypothetical protein
LKAEKESLQKELEKAKSDLEAAKFTPAPASAATNSTPASADPAASAPLSSSEREDLENKIKELEADKAAYDQVSFVGDIDTLTAPPCPPLDPFPNP